MFTSKHCFIILSLNLKAPMRFFLFLNGTFSVYSKRRTFTIKKWFQIRVWHIKKTCLQIYNCWVRQFMPLAGIFSLSYTYSKEYVHLERKRGEGGASSRKLNLTDPCHTVYRASTMVEVWQAGGLGHLLQYSICASTMPRAQNRTEKGSILL